MATIIEQTTARLMRDKLQAKLDALYSEQESNKPQTGEQEKYPLGGLIASLASGGLKQKGYGDAYKMLNNTPGFGIQAENQLMGDLNRTNKDWGNKNPMFFGAGGTGQGLLGMALQYGPAAYNIGRGLFEKPDVLPDVDYSRFNNPYEAKIRSLMADRNYNIDPILSGNIGAQNALNRNIRNVGNMSSGQYLGNLQAGASNRMRADAGAYAQKYNVENQYLADEANVLNNLGQMRSRSSMFGIPYQYRVDESNLANQAAKRNMFGQGLTDLQQIYQTDQLEGSMKDMDINKLNMLKDMFRTNQWMSSMQGFRNNIYKRTW